MMDALLRHLAHASLAVCVLVPLICAVRRLFRKQIDHRILYALWLLVVLRLALPLSIAAQLPQTEAPAPRMPSVLDMGDALSKAGLPVYDFDGWAAQKPAQTTPTAPFFALWAVGAAAVAAGMIWSNRSFRRRLDLQPMDADLWEKYRQRFAGQGVRLPPVAFTAAVKAPCLYGAVRPVILLPEDALWQDWLPHALLHEACHARAQDTRWALVRLAACCAFWFHPLVWLAARLSRADAELACDARVIGHIGQREARLDYARALVSLAAQRAASPILGTGVAFADERLMDRIQHIVKQRTSKRALSVAVLCGLLLCMAVSFVLAEPGEALSAVATKTAAFCVEEEDGTYAEAALPDTSLQIDYLAGGWAAVTTGGQEGFVKVEEILFAQDAFAGATAWVNSPGRTDRLILRAMPTTTSEVKERFFNGTPVTIETFGKMWCEVTANQTRGYMMTRYLLIGPETWSEEAIPAVPPLE